MKQKDALEILKLGENVFLTGPAGSGKTFLLNQYIDYLKKNKIGISVTATTGIAATHLNGRTIHSWCGVGLNEELTDAQIKILKRQNYLASRILPSKVLIIDEISMLNAKRLDLVDYVCKIFKKNLQPFGGMQVVFCGDFFQLPPVARGVEDKRFVTDSVIWNNMDIKLCYLEEQYRQDDKTFVKILNDIRGGLVNESTLKSLVERYNKPLKLDIEPTKLYTHNINVDFINNAELVKIKEKERQYLMESEGIPYLVQNLKDSYCLASEVLKLKIGAVVMFVKNNFGKGYANGTLGKVVGFDKESGLPIVKTFSGQKIIAQPERWVMEDGDEVVASIKQVPLRLAWAITVHKSQGMSLDCAEIDLSRTFEYGMGYVALSRVRSLEGIKLLGINAMALKVDARVGELDKEFIIRSEKDLAEHKATERKVIKIRQKKFLRESKDGYEELMNALGF